MKVLLRSKFVPRLAVQGNLYDVIVNELQEPLAIMLRIHRRYFSALKEKSDHLENVCLGYKEGGGGQTFYSILVFCYTTSCTKYDVSQWERGPRTAAPPLFHSTNRSKELSFLCGEVWIMTHDHEHWTGASQATYSICFISETSKFKGRFWTNFG